MDDAESIVLLALRQAGVTVPEDARGVSQLSPEQLVPIYAHALTLLRGGGGPPVAAEFPQQRAERFRVCADLVAAFQQLGFRGELTFQKFLYPSGPDRHRLLRFLLDQLSKTPVIAGRGRGAARRGRGGRIEVDDFGSSKIGRVVRRALAVSRDGAAGAGDGARVGIQRSDASEGIYEVSELGPWGIPFRTSAVRLSSAKAASKKPPPLITIQPKRRAAVVASVLELNSKNAEELVRSAEAQFAQLARQADRARRAGELPAEKKVITRGKLLSSCGNGTVVSYGNERSSTAVSKEERQPPVVVGGPIEIEALVSKYQAEISSLQEELSILASREEKIAADKAAVDRTGVELEEGVKGAAEKAGLLNRRRELMKVAVDMASEDPDAALQRMEATVRDGTLSLESLREEWSSVRTSLEERIANSDKTAVARNSKIQTKLQRMRIMRQEMKDMTARLWAREEARLAAAEQDKVVRKGATRHTYLERITELIRNSKKQDADIARIIHDTLGLQRESNLSQDKLRRLHAIVDETVFRDAKRDPVCKRAYILLNTVHKSFESVVRKVLEMDKISREISEVQAKLEDLEKRPLDAANVEADLEAIRAENRALEAALSGQRLPQSPLDSVDGQLGKRILQ